MPVVRHRFEGRIAGVGSSSGVRVVVGAWAVSPFGAFTDVMVEKPNGHRLLLAPTEPVADYVAHTYTFDEVRVQPVELTLGDTDWVVATPSFHLNLQLGGRLPLGRLLRLIPPRVGTSVAWTRVTDPIARALVRGVRTRGEAHAGRREYYAATDLHRVIGLSGRLNGFPLGVIAPVDPPCRFGFGSTPRTPSVTSLVTTVESIEPGRGGLRERSRPSPR